MAPAAPDKKLMKRISYLYSMSNLSVSSVLPQAIRCRWCHIRFIRDAFMLSGATMALLIQPSHPTSNRINFGKGISSTSPVKITNPETHRS